MQLKKYYGFSFIFIFSLISWGIYSFNSGNHINIEKVTEVSNVSNVVANPSHQHQLNFSNNSIEPNSEDISNILITSIRPRFAAISFVTEKEGDIKILFGKKGEPLEPLNVDDFCESSPNNTHYFEIKNLERNMPYDFVIEIDGKRHDHNGKPFTFKTAPFLFPPVLPALSRIRGNVYHFDGSPAECAIVYLTIIRKDEGHPKSISATLSVVTNTEGHWEIDQNYARTLDLEQYFNFQLGKDGVELLAQGGESGERILSINSLQDKRIPDIILPGSVDDGEWTSSCIDNVYAVGFVGAGLGNSEDSDNPKSLIFDDFNNIRFIKLQVVVKETKAPPPIEVVIKTDLEEQHLTQSTFIDKVYIYETFVQPTNQLSVHVVGEGESGQKTPRAILAYVFYEDANFAASGFFPENHGIFSYDEKVFNVSGLISNGEPFNINLPVPENSLNQEITVSFALADIQDNDRYIQLSIKSPNGNLLLPEKRIYVPEIDNDEFLIFSETIESLPEDIDFLTLTLKTPLKEDLGDSVYLGGVNLSVRCNQ